MNTFSLRVFNHILLTANLFVSAVVVQTNRKKLLMRGEGGNRQVSEMKYGPGKQCLSDNFKWARNLIFTAVVICIPCDEVWKLLLRLLPPTNALNPNPNPPAPVPIAEL